MSNPTDYALLYQSVKSLGLLEKDKSFYVYQTVFILMLFVVGLITINHIPIGFFTITVIALYIAFIQGQIALIAHDIVHRQVFESPILNSTVGIIVWNLLLGGSSDWWREQHNNHHIHPNDHHKDPSINLKLFSFSQEQLKHKTKFEKLFIKRQAFLYFPLMAFMVIALRTSSIVFILKKRTQLYVPELIAITVYVVIYPFLALWTFGLWYGILFAILNHAFFGIYLGFIFAPNHKGMPMINSGRLDYLRQQVITARNIKGNFFIDIIYGGLNHQIEHHLFPFMPRSNLKKVKPIVEKFCVSKNISYHETGIWQSFQEIFTSLREESIQKTSL